MKGIILAGGRGSRLYPITKGTCKQLLPIFDKPMIYYPLAVLMMAQIREILLITTPEDSGRFKHLLGDGSQWGISLSYDVQKVPQGIADSFVIAEEFIGGGSVALILGDNIFYGHNFSNLLQEAKELHEGAMVFGYEVHDPERYGVLAFNEEGHIYDIIEKPKNPPSRYAVTGLYFYDNRVIEIAKSLKPSARGEYEITDVNVAYLQRGELQCHLFERGFAWLDTGTPTAMQQAASYVQTIQERQGIKIGCVEEIAYKMGFITLEQLFDLADGLSASEYGEYLKLQCINLLRNESQVRDRSWSVLPSKGTASSIFIRSIPK
ncbi:MAG: glucose-1-phosphate thymidylyltransferase RfbA [Verrucomicrobia bacterium]|nr:glucose-1-phosphate thymidylyltransferase RfbA [Verrucomicrobiota bacterium]